MYHSLTFDIALGLHMCRWCRFGSARKSMQPHHPHREMRTRGRVPLVLMAHRPHWKTQPYRTRNRGSQVQGLLPCVSRAGSPFK
ncbi:unnamed protein product [Staurois parvus]|uniref:Uncharacterized protein n=1 Tax=Staurois parvus TaxID=386267 RepID=A0ABN9BU22_9NEOB|nr:unnamed protein product [Staurois parvus]